MRFFRLDAFRRMGPTIEIGTDASPWGMGGWLAVNGTITQHYACDVSKDDAEIYGHAIGK